MPGLSSFPMPSVLFYTTLAPRRYRHGGTAGETVYLLSMDRKRVSSKCQISRPKSRCET